MSVLKASRSAQYPLTAEFTWTFADTMLNTSGASDGFASAAAHVFDAIPLPANAVVISGSLVVTTAFNGTTYAVIVGDSGATNRYLTTSDYKATGLTALVPTGYIGTGENIRLTITPTGTTATTGKATLRVTYIISGRSNEVQIT